MLKVIDKLCFRGKKKICIKFVYNDILINVDWWEFGFNLKLEVIYWVIRRFN